MRIFLDGEEYFVSPEQEARLVGQFQAMGESMYEKQPPEFQLLGMAAARWILAKWESAVRRLRGKEISLHYRPAKKQDPVLRLNELVAEQLRGMIAYAEFSIQTDGRRNAIGCSISFPAQSEGGRSLVFDGNQWQRENNGAEIPGRALY